MMVSPGRTIGIFPGMTVVQMLIGRTRSTVRKAATILAATQIMLGSAPLTESESRSAAPHVESAGVQLHHAHHEETCIACVAHRALGGAEPAHRSALVESVGVVAPDAASGSFDPRRISGPPRSRAPPATVLG